MVDELLIKRIRAGDEDALKKADISTLKSIFTE